MFTLSVYNKIILWTLLISINEVLINNTGINITTDYQFNYNSIFLTDFKLSTFFNFKNITTLDKVDLKINH